MTSVRSVCCYCGTGCGLLVESAGRRIVSVTGDPAHPANRGQLCSKGATLHLTALQATRVLHPELRRTRDAARARLGWDEALEVAAARFGAIIRAHGPDAVAFYVSGQLLTEDYFVFNKLARALVGTNNIDSNSRLCMSSAVSAYKRTLGADAPPACYDDIALADCLLIAGGNPAYAHPVVFRRVMEAKAAKPEVKLIVIDPRLTDTAAAADLHLAVAPGTDAILFGAMLHVLIWEGLVDGRFVAAHTAGFAAARDAVRELTPQAAAQACGLGARGADDIVTAARWFGQAPAALSMWCQGLNQSHHGTDNCAALIHLHLAAGQIGKPGAGPFSLTGQPNAMGGRETGTMATLLPGHRDPASAADRADVAAIWGVPALPERPGKTALELFDALTSGEIRAVWIAGTNPAQSLPDQARVRAALARAEFVVVQEAFRDTETAVFADLLLPAATWGEKDGTMTNSERCIARVRAAVPPPGEARPDWQIARDFALQLGAALERPDAARLFAFENPAAIFKEHAVLGAGRDLDFSGLDYAVIERAGPQQWPYPSGATAGQARLYQDQRFATPDGRARFVAISLRTVAEAPDARYPLHMNSGRLRDQWHSMSRTGLAARLYEHGGGPAALCHPADLERRGIMAGELAQFTSRRGSVVLRALADAAQQPGHVFIPMHWGRRRLSHDGANALTLSVRDPYSQQPELKHAAIRIDKVELPWRARVLRRALDAETAARWNEALAPLLGRFGYAALSLSGRDAPLLSLEIAHAAPAAAAVLGFVLAALDMPEAALIAYTDERQGIVKRALIDAAGLSGLVLLGEVAAADWLADAMRAGRPAAELRRWLFSPLAQPPANLACARGRTVCTCNNVGERDIAQAIGAGADTLERVQAQLPCGTGCGACVPEVRRMLAQAGGGAG